MVVVLGAIALVYFVVKKKKGGNQASKYASGVNATPAAVSVSSVSATMHSIDVAGSSAPKPGIELSSVPPEDEETKI